MASRYKQLPDFPLRGSWLTSCYHSDEDARHGQDPGSRDAVLLTTLITVLFVGVSSAVLWLSIGAD